MNPYSMPIYKSSTEVERVENGWSKAEIDGLDVTLAPESNGRRQTFLQSPKLGPIYKICVFVRADHQDEDLKFYVAQFRALEATAEKYMGGDQ